MWIIHTYFQCCMGARQLMYSQDRDMLVNVEGAYPDPEI